jgi:hypothetical protein
MAQCHVNLLVWGPEKLHQENTKGKKRTKNVDKNKVKGICLTKLTIHHYTCSDQ